MKANSMTLAIVIATCADLVSLEQGLEIHEEVIKSGFQDDLFVANALVNLYAKCGSIEVSCNMFDKMDYKDVASWNAMVAGYGVHGFGNPNALRTNAALWNITGSCYLCQISICVMPFRPSG